MMLTFYIKMNNFAGLYKQKQREGINKVANVCRLIGRLGTDSWPDWAATKFVTDTLSQRILSIALISSNVFLLDAINNYGVISYLYVVIIFVLLQFISVK